MAGDWVRTRVLLARHPKVFAMATFLDGYLPFRVWWFDGTGIDAARVARVTETVTPRALRMVTVSALIQLWGACRELASNERLESVSLDALDEIAGGIPGLGRAMSLPAVQWAIYDAESQTVILPEFLKHNTPAGAGPRTNAERQAAYRARKKLESNETVTARCNGVTLQEKIKREKKNTPPTPPSGGKRAPRIELNKPSAGFDRFWAAYPRHTARAKALQAWNRLAPDEALEQTILAAVARQKQTEQWQRGVIPHATTWLNQRRWEDELPAAGRVAVSPPIDYAERTRKLREQADQERSKIVPLAQVAAALNGKQH